VATLQIAMIIAASGFIYQNTVSHSTLWRLRQNLTDAKSIQQQWPSVYSALPWSHDQVTRAGDVCKAENEGDMTAGRATAEGKVLKREEEMPTRSTTDEGRDNTALDSAVSESEYNGALAVPIRSTTDEGRDNTALDSAVSQSEYNGALAVRAEIDSIKSMIQQMIQQTTPTPAHKEHRRRRQDTSVENTKVILLGDSSVEVQTVTMNE